MAWEDYLVPGSMLGSGVSDYEYRQRVRRYKPSSLLPLIAAASVPVQRAAGLAEQPVPQVHAVGAGGRGPRVASLRQRVNRADATERNLLQILNAYGRFDDPFLRDQDLHAFMLRMAGERMTWQSSRVRGAGPDGGHLRPDPTA